MQKYQINPVKVTEVEQLQRLSRTTFKATFSFSTKPQDMANFLATAYAKRQLLQELQNPLSHFFFLRLGKEIAGYLKVNVGLAQTEKVAANALEVERIYLKQFFQHQGLGRQLLKYAFKLAKQQKKDVVWLGVYERNYSAQHFYARMGFHRVGQHVFQVGHDPQTDYILLRKV